MNQTMHEEKETEDSVSLVEASQLIFLDLKKLRFSKHGAHLRLTVEEDRSYLQVNVLRAFPLSEPQRFLSVRDHENKEIGLIVNPAELTPDDRKLVEEDLGRRYLAPVITRIVAAKERFGTVDWTVETDRGLRRFTTRNLRENMSRPTPGRLILNDVDGNSYDIRRLDDLGQTSQALLFRHL
jgi:hypothetical protein